MDRNDLILVTGGAGFIGARLVEALAGRGLRIRVATSDFRHCAQVARFPVELVKADLGDHESLARAAAGCTVIFHAAYRFGGSPKDERRMNFDGTCALAEAFLEGKGRRFVQLSSIEAYGDQRGGDLTEETPKRPIRGKPYGNIKQDIERALLDLHRTRGLAVSILQPTIVYGPYGYFFTIRPIEELRSTRVVLPAGGVCNAVYVDDVVSAALLAAERETAIGEAFIISGPSPTTWRQFYGAYEKMLGKEAVIELDDDQMEIAVRRQRARSSLPGRLHGELAKRPALRQRLLNLPPQRWLLAGGRRLLPDPAKAAIKRRYDAFWDASFNASETSSLPFIPAESWRVIYTAEYHARIDKARAKLGYNPAFDLDHGMARTAEWARWANLLPI
ncbi:NAD-dependent epimerase/dehydratase family protein [Bradyrhizobium sp. dw_78]|uniref:NAD-dependent epimerase/dehydratase family protein n=1 Tax=Bradyrhizobium sp. dw_78 TaxID=2719793 RepID=UPI001BD588CD|nr:NAD-dependent epimerase/dehydratase family protein [Bradyrhizobium sp. dw_78]